MSIFQFDDYENKYQAGIIKWVKICNKFKNKANNVMAIKQSRWADEKMMKFLEEATKNPPGYSPYYHCWKFRVSDGMAMFYKHGNRIFPPGYGVVYSLYSANPNDSNDEYVERLKPFEHLAGNWYSSPKMILGGPRRDIRVGAPKPFIDKSKIIDVPAEELHRFDNWQSKKYPNS